MITFPNTCTKDIMASLSERVGKVEIDQSILSASIEAFPKIPKCKNDSGLPWGVIVAPFVGLNNIESTTNNGLYRKYKSNSDYHRVPPVQCPECHSFLNPFCKVKTHQWYCSICFSWNPVYDGKSLYKHPQLKDDFIDYVSNESVESAAKREHRIVHVAIVDVTLSDESINIAKTILTKAIEEMPNGIHFSLLTVSYNRIGLFDFRTKNIPKIIYTTIVSSTTDETYAGAEKHRPCATPNVPLFELVNGFEHLSVGVNDGTRVVLKNAVNAIRSESRIQYNSKTQDKMKFALNGIIYSINESFGTAARQNDVNVVLEHEEENGNATNNNMIPPNNNMKKRNNTFNSRNSNNNNLDKVILDGVSVTILTGNNHDQTEKNSISNNHSSSGAKTNAVNSDSKVRATWFAGKNSLKDEILNLVKYGISYSFGILDNDYTTSNISYYAPLVEWTGGSIERVDTYNANINNENNQTSIDIVVDELFLKDFAYSSRVSIVTTPKFKIRNMDSLYPIGAFHAVVENNKDGNEIGGNQTEEQAYYSRQKIHDHMKQFVSGRCDRSTSFPIHFEFVDSNGFDNKWSANPGVQVIFEYHMFNASTSKAEKHFRVFTERFGVADDLIDLYSSTNIYNTFSLMAHKVTIERSMHAENKDVLKHLLMDFLIYLTAQFSKKISQNVKASITKLKDLRKGISNGSLEPLIRLFYGLSQLAFFETAASSVERLLLFRIKFCNANIEEWIHSIYPAPTISRQNDQSFQLYLKDYDKWLNVLEEETNEYMKTC